MVSTAQQTQFISDSEWHNLINFSGTTSLGHIRVAQDRAGVTIDIRQSNLHTAIVFDEHGILVDAYEGIRGMGGPCEVDLDAVLIAIECARRGIE